MKSPTASARMRQTHIAREYPIEHFIDDRGIKLRGKIERVGPCPRCGGADRFSINIKKQCWNCRGCQKGGDVIALVQHLDGVDFKAAVEILAGKSTAQNYAVEKRIGKDGNGDYEHQQHRKASWLWQQRQPIKDTAAEIYLRKARGYPGVIPPTLEYLPPAKPSHHPAMIAAFAEADEIEPGVLAAPSNVNSVHLTLLRSDGSGKADVTPNKIIVGRPLGRPIVVAPPNDLLGLAICEGIEDALTAHAATGLGAWAAGAAGFMPALGDTVASHVEVVTIVEDDDDAGRKGTAVLAERLIERGIEVLIARAEHARS